MRKTTLELPEDLLREVKMRAVQENRRIKDVVAEALRRGLMLGDDAPSVVNRVALPLVMTTRPTDPAEDLTPERVAAILLEQEATSVLGQARGDG